MAKKKNQSKNKKNNTFNKKDNICNICQIEKPLSKDHVPPRACPPVKQRIILKLLPQILRGKGFDTNPKFSQNGVYYKTICEKCNNDILGGQYDRYLGDFTNTIETLIDSSFTLPQEFKVECYPNAIMRSILGHLLAAKTETDEVVDDTLIRPCVLDSSLPIPEEINVFYWIYPYEEIVIFRDFIMPSIRGDLKTIGHFNMIKFYPVAFLIVHQLKSYEGLDSLHHFNKLPFDQKSSISIKLNPIRSSTWPEECVGMENFLAFGRSGNDAISSIPHIKQIKV